MVSQLIPTLGELTIDLLGDSFVEKPEFISLLRNLFYFNKVCIIL